MLLGIAMVKMIAEHCKRRLHNCFQQSKSIGKNLYRVLEWKFDRP